MSKIKKLITYYFDNYKSKIFYKDVAIDNKKFAILYNYNYNEELTGFKENFVKYLPFYVRSSENLKHYETNNEIDEFLEIQSKKIWNKSTVFPKRDYKRNGIFGELFLDFYMRIIKKKKTILTYSNKRSFNSDSETTGYDNVLYCIDDNKDIELYFCEAKFMENISNVRHGFLSDINGSDKNESHLSKKYFNEYLDFIVSKGSDLDDEDIEILEPFFYKLNSILNDSGDFLEFIINENLKINLVFFAIFKDNNKVPMMLEEYYDSINDDALARLKEMGLNNYSIEIVFIPTDNKSTVIKEGIFNFYG